MTIALALGLAYIGAGIFIYGIRDSAPLVIAGVDRRLGPLLVLAGVLVLAFHVYYDVIGGR